MTDSNARGHMLLDSKAFLLFIHSWICTTSLLRDFIATVLLGTEACNLHRQDRPKIGKSRIAVTCRQTFWVSVRVNDLPRAIQVSVAAPTFHISYSLLKTPVLCSQHIFKLPCDLSFLLWFYISKLGHDYNSKQKFKIALSIIPRQYNSFCQILNRTSSYLIPAQCKKIISSDL